MKMESHPKKKQYCNWVKGGLGLKYAKDGLDPFLEDVVKEEHADMLRSVKRKFKPGALSCTQCDLRRLKPNHIQDKYNRCPLGTQPNCNCQTPKICKQTCPDNFCGAIYEEIIKRHCTRTPYWKNTDIHTWGTDPWSVAKCYIKAPGYGLKASAVDMDVSGLLHVLINNSEIQRRHINTVITGTDVFTKVRESRNAIFHSSTMELQDHEVDSYIDDMIAMLQDPRELSGRPESQTAIQKLQELKKENFTITAKSEEEVIKATMKAIQEKEAEIKKTVEMRKAQIEEKEEELKKMIDRSKDELEDKHEDLKKTIDKGKSEIEEKEEKLKKQVDEGSRGLNKKQSDIITAIEEKQRDTMTDINKKQTFAEARIDRKQEDAASEIDKKQDGAVSAVNQKQVGAMTEIDQKQKCAVAEIDQKQDGAIAEINKKHKGAVAALDNKQAGAMAEIDQTQKVVMNEIDAKKAVAVAEIDQKMTEFRAEAKEKMKQLDERHQTVLNELSTTALKQGEMMTYVQDKLDYQRRLIKLYTSRIVKVSAIPLQPNIGKRDIADIYVSPWLIVDDGNKKDESSQYRHDSDKVKGLKEVFQKEGKLVQEIFVLGDAGCGKTALCKNLVKQWCLAHSNEGPENNDLAEMLKFDFLFYLSLRCNVKYTEINTMLKRRYGHPILDKILENDSSRCLIVMDGLDEWNPDFEDIPQFQTEGLPIREFDQDYTVLITSRQWKIESLGITDDDMQHRLTLRGIDMEGSARLIEKTTDVLNSISQENRDASEFKEKLKEHPLSDIEHTPMMLQQMIGLWFENKLQGTSRCAIYSSMLDLYFSWADQREPYDSALKEMKQKSKRLKDYRLPKYLKDLKSCVRYKYVFRHISRLAYEALFSEKKEARLSFSESLLKQLIIPSEVIHCCLKLGIMTEEQAIGLFSEPLQSSYSFVHKSIQEFLAAVYVAIECGQLVGFSQIAEDANVLAECQKMVRTLFYSCKTVTDILEQTNVCIMLCGLEPNLATPVSQFIYNSVNTDERTIKYRERLTSEPFDFRKPLFYVQKCINDCMKEVVTSDRQTQHKFYIADIVNETSSWSKARLKQCQELIRYKHLVIFDSVLSLYYDGRRYDTHDDDYLFSFIKSVCESSRLVAVKLHGIAYSVRLIWLMENCLCHDMSRLQTLVVTGGFNYYTGNDNMKTVVKGICQIKQLVSFKFDDVRLTHDTCTLLCTALTGATTLHQIHLLYVYCEDCSEKYEGQHNLDISRHEQLRYVWLKECDIRVSQLNPTNLNKCKLLISDRDEVLDNLCDARNLKHLKLDLHTADTDMHTHQVNTEKFTKLLESPIHLSYLKLRGCTLTDNIILHPAEMKNLNYIKLRDVTMCEETWCRLLDSLPAIPQPVRVNTIDLCVIRREELQTSMSLSDEMKTKAMNIARQCVRDREMVFKVTEDCESLFFFCLFNFASTCHL